MAIQQKAILGQDCTLVFETQSLTTEFVNWDDASWQEAYVASDFVVAQSTSTEFVTPRKESFALTVRLKRGLNTTYLDFKTLFDTEKLTDIQMTDMPSYSDLVAEYGEPKVMRIGAAQGNDFGTGDIMVRFGYIEHGYTPV